jgi:hypothetical protein
VVKKGTKKPVAEAKVLDDKTVKDLEKAILVMKDGTIHEFTQFAGVFATSEEEGEEIVLECRSICHLAVPVEGSLQVAALLKDMSVRIGKETFIDLLGDLKESLEKRPY